MLLEKIKQDLTTARKEKRSFDVIRLSTLFGEVEKVGKDKGNRPTTDEEAIAVIKKFIVNAQESLKAILSREEFSDNTQMAYLEEIAQYESYLPKQLSEEDIVRIIMTLPPSYKIGDVMKSFKENFSGQYDGKKVSDIFKSLTVK